MGVRLADIIDIALLQEMLDGLWRANGIPLGLIDAAGEILVATGWQEICTDYHARHPEIGRRCLLNRLAHFRDEADPVRPGGPVKFLCINGLIDLGLPIVCEGEFLGMLFLGQFFDRPPDREAFRRQATRLGFEPERYLALVDKVPVIPSAAVDHYLTFHAALIRLLSESGLRKLREEQAREELALSRQALVESEEGFRSIVEETSLGIHMYRLEDDDRLIFTGYNPAADAILRVDNRRFLGRELCEAFPALIGTGVPEGYRQVCTTGRPWHAEQIDYADGVLSGAFEVHAFRTGPNRMAGLFMDITERVRAVDAVRRSEAELRDREEQIRLLLNSSGEAIFGVDREGLCTFANPMCLELLGLNREDEMLGIRTHELMHHTRSDGLPYPEEDCLIYNAFRHGDSVHAVGELFWNSGGEGFPVEYWAHPVIKDGEVCGAVVNFIDITERQRAEKALQDALADARKAREQISAIVQSVADALVVVDPAGRVLAANPAALELFGDNEAQIVGRPLAERLDDRQLLDRVGQVVTGAEPAAVVDLAPWRDGAGRERCLQARVARIDVEGSGLYGVVAILRDVTREREIDRLKDDFISTAAHELRTPITSIFGYAELMLDQLPQLPEAQLRDYLGIICNRSEALTLIIEEMLDLSRMQSGQVIRLQKRAGDIGSLAKEAVSHYQVANAGHDLQLNLASPLPQLEYDAAKLRQVFDNLLSNAFKFSPRGSTVTIDVAGRDGDVVVTVTDLGVGMTAEQVERIFDKFYRADASTTAASGLGLGMSLVKGIIEGHGGRIWVTSVPGRGTTVSFALPALPAAGD